MLLCLASVTEEEERWLPHAHLDLERETKEGGQLPPPPLVQGGMSLSSCHPSSILDEGEG